MKPANVLPTLCGEMFIVNLQKTPLDATASCVTRCRIDLFCQLLMAELGIAEAPSCEWEEEYNQVVCVCVLLDFVSVFFSCIALMWFRLKSLLSAMRQRQKLSQERF